MLVIDFPFVLVVLFVPPLASCIDECQRTIFRRIFAFPQSGNLFHYLELARVPPGLHLFLKLFLCKEWVMYFTFRTPFAVIRIADIFICIGIDPCSTLHFRGTAYFTYINVFIIRLFSESSAVIKRNRTLNKMLLIIFRQLGKEPLRRTEYGFVCQCGPFIREVPVHNFKYGLALFLAPGVPHIVEEAGYCIFRMIFHDSSVWDSTSFVSSS